MEKYSQFRDRGSGISPFIPAKTPSSFVYSLLQATVFVCRLPFFVAYCAAYFLVLSPLPLPAALRKLLLWGMLAIPGVWWVDLQLDGVKRGSLSQQPPARFPHPRSVIAAQFTSPIDALYLAAIFDPVFTISYPDSRKVYRVSLLRAIVLALTPPAAAILMPPPDRLTTLRALADQYPHRVIVVFPEMTTTNGKGILPLSPSLLSAAAHTKIFPVSMRYTPPDITTPVPGPAAWVSFFWNLLSRPTHCIRVRIADGVTRLAPGDLSGADDSAGSADPGADLEPEEKQLLDHVSDNLARLARNKRVGLTLNDKIAFVEAWSKGRR